MARSGGMLTTIALVTVTLLVLGVRFTTSRRTCHVKIKLDQKGNQSRQWNFPSLRVGRFMGFIPCMKAEKLCKRLLPQHVTRLLGGGSVNPILGQAGKTMCARFTKTLPAGHRGYVWAIWNISACKKRNELYLGRICCNWVDNIYLPQDACPSGTQ
ncbi:uncharacterized protein [Panulirus ornatus]|uniref:uncharacterized protein n=1 Tax=Panulirus ornatus TaxID=150431 RepID=UPI003A8830EB